ncbi:MAG: TIGR01777 family oxidoreductase [Gaiella sp.]
MSRRIVVAGGRGFLGATITDRLRARGDAVTVLTRSRAAEGEAEWNGRSLGEWAASLDGADAVINLCGRSVDCRHTARNRRAIMMSRLESTRAIGQAVAECTRPPAVWLNASTAVIYHPSDQLPCNEDSPIGDSLAARTRFDIRVATAWERELRLAPAKDTRKVALRIGMVLGNGTNSAFPILCRLARFGLGGPLAGGAQCVSWVHELDVANAVDWLIARVGIEGPVNVVSPSPVTNAALMAAIREALGVTFGVALPGAALKIGGIVLRTEPAMVMRGHLVVPQRLLESGFAFAYPDLADAVGNLVADGQRDTSPVRT